MTNSNTLPFSSTDYDKLQMAVFPTVRRRDKYGDVGDVRPVTAGDGAPQDREVVGRAEVVAKETATLDNVPEGFLLYDTQSARIEAAIGSLNKFYRNPIDPDEPLTVYWNRWVEGPDMEVLDG